MNDFWPLVAFVLLMQISEENNVLEENGSPPRELLNVRSGWEQGGAVRSH